MNNRTIAHGKRRERFRGFRGVLVGALVLGCLVPAWAGDWPAYAKDMHRSNATDEQLDFPLRRAWAYRCAQPPRPAWPEPVKALNRFDFDYAFHPVVAGGLVCFGSSADDTVRALDAGTGEEKWHFIAGGPVRFAPQIEKGKVYFSSDDGVIYCLEAATGKLSWKFNAAPADDRLVGNERMISRWPARTGVLVDGGVVYATAGMWPADGIFVYALDAVTGTVLWCNDTSGLIYDVRTLHMGADFATYGVCPQGALVASDEVLLVPTGKALPAGFDRKTGKLLYYRIDADSNGQGGTWVTVDGKKFHTVPYIISFAIDTGKQAANNFGGGTIPAYTKNIPGKAYSTFETVSAIVTGGKAYARKAHGMVLAGTTLVIGRDGSVTAEGTAPRPAADLRFGLAGDDLAVVAHSDDRKVAQAVKPWDGSCVEIFGAMPGQTPIGQVFLVPGTKTAPAAAYRSLDGKVVPAPEIRIKFKPTAKGYELSALIPLGQLALDKATPDFRLEAQVTIPGPDGTLQHGTLFGSVTAHQNSAKFGPFQLKPKEALASADAVSAALAGVKPVAVTMNDSSELWRAEVEGNARGLAVANGRLYVSTSRGMMYAFEAGIGGGVQGSGFGVQEATIANPAIGGTSPKPVPRFAGSQIQNLKSEVSSQNQKIGSGMTDSDKSKIENLKSKIVNLLQQAGVDRGYALVVGDADGQVSTALAAETQLHVVNVLTDEPAAAALREKLLAGTTLYGSRIHVQVVPRFDALPFAQYFANAVIVAGLSPKALAEGGLSGKEFYRVLRPCGGILLFSGLPVAETGKLIEETGALESEIKQTLNTEHLSSASRDRTLNIDPAIIRGQLPGALDWDSKIVLDQRVKWPLRLLWFGGPGPAQVMDRKQFTNIGPAANGRFFTLNEDTLTAVDAYNGLILWSRPIPKYFADLRLADDVHLIADADRIGGKTYGRGINADGSNVYLTLSGYFGTNGPACMLLDARTGEQKKIFGPYAVPQQISLAGPQTWPLEIDAAHSGAVTLQPEADGLLLKLATKDPAITKLDRWDLYFDFRPPETRYGLFDRGAFSLSVFPADGTAPATWKKGAGEGIPAVTVEGIPPSPSIGDKHAEHLPAVLRTTLQAGAREAWNTVTTVRLPWAELAGLTGGKPASFGFGVRLNACDNADKERVVQRYLFCDLAADGLNNGWANVILGAAGGTVASPAVVVGPYTAMPKLPQAKGFNPVPGSTPVAQAPRRHPFTGVMGPKLYQTGGVCGGPAFSAFTRFDRSTAIAIYDFADDSGTRTFDGVKPGCATTMLASQGLLLSVEGRGGCFCTFNFQTSLALAPVEKRWNEDWALFFDRNADSRIMSAAINLGAPGDRRADDGTLWLSFPRLDKGFGNPELPPNSTAVGIGRRAMPGNLRVPLTVELFPDGGTYRFNADRVLFGGTDHPWLYASGYRGIRKATLKLDFGAPLVSLPAAQPPVLDGKPNDDLWAGQTQAVLPAAKADVFLRHDGEQLYLLARRPAFIGSRGDVAAWIRDAPKKGSQDDQSFYNDSCWEVFLGDAKSGKVMHLRVMPTGARFDALSESATNENVKWNGVWTSAVTADTNGFALELAIPWKTLADAGLDKDSLSINIMANGPLRQSEALRFPGLRGRERCENFVPVGLGQAPAGGAAPSFTVRLHFAEPDADAKPGQRVFDVKIQGQVVLKGLDVVKEAGAPRTALVKEFKGIPASDALTIEFVSAFAGEPTASNNPILCAFEVSDHAK